MSFEEVLAQRLAKHDERARRHEQTVQQQRQWLVDELRFHGHTGKGTPVEIDVIASGDYPEVPQAAKRTSTIEPAVNRKLNLRKPSVASRNTRDSVKKEKNQAINPSPQREKLEKSTRSKQLASTSTSMHQVPTHPKRSSSSNRASVEERLLQYGKERLTRLDVAVAERQRELRLKEDAETRQRSSRRCFSSSTARCVPATETSIVSCTEPEQEDRRVRRLLKAMEGATANVTYHPQISSKSERLSRTRRKRDKTDHLSIYETLSSRQTVRDTEEKEHGIRTIPMRSGSRAAHNGFKESTEIQGKPLITNRAKNIKLDLPASERLYQHAKERQHEDQIVLGADFREMMEKGPECTFKPAVSQVASKLQRRKGHAVYSDLYDDAKNKQQSLADASVANVETLDEMSFHPKINETSRTMASRLPETTRERLCRPFRGHFGSENPRIPSTEVKEDVLGSHQDHSGAVDRSIIPTTRCLAFPPHELPHPTGSAHFSHGKRSSRSYGALTRDVEEADNNSQFKPRLNDVSLALVARRQSAPFTERQRMWLEKRNKNVRKARESKERQEYEECTFKPKRSHSPVSTRPWDGEDQIDTDNDGNPKQTQWTDAHHYEEDYEDVLVEQVASDMSKNRTMRNEFASVGGTAYRPVDRQYFQQRGASPDPEPVSSWSSDEEVDVEDDPWGSASDLEDEDYDKESQMEALRIAYEALEKAALVSKTIRSP